jgi:hypothetical protein
LDIAFYVSLLLSSPVQSSPVQSSSVQSKGKSEDKIDRGQIELKQRDIVINSHEELVGRRRRMGMSNQRGRELRPKMPKNAGINAWRGKEK